MGSICSHEIYVLYFQCSIIDAGCEIDNGHWHVPCSLEVEVVCVR